MGCTIKKIRAEGVLGRLLQRFDGGLRNDLGSDNCGRGGCSVSGKRARLGLRTGRCVEALGFYERAPGRLYRPGATTSFSWAQLYKACSDLVRCVFTLKRGIPWNERMAGKEKSVISDCQLKLEQLSYSLVNLGLNS